jgi:hypothetical protein
VLISSYTYIIACPRFARKGVVFISRFKKREYSTTLNKQESKEKKENIDNIIAEFIIEKNLQGQEGFVTITHGNILSYREEKDQDSLYKNMEQEYIKDGYSEEEANNFLSNDFSYFQIIPTSPGKSSFSFVIVEIFSNGLKSNIIKVDRDNEETTIEKLT